MARHADDFMAQPLVMTRQITAQKAVRTEDHNLRIHFVNPSFQIPLSSRSFDNF
jgi:hypothetical protein